MKNKMEIKTIKSRVNKSVEKKEIKALAEDEEEEPKVKRKRINKKINSNHINYLIKENEDEDHNHLDYEKGEDLLTDDEDSSSSYNDEDTNGDDNDNASVGEETNQIKFRKQCLNQKEDLMKVLIKGLNSQDDDLIDLIFESKNEDLIKEIINQLPNDLITLLFKYLCKICMLKGDKESNLIWLKKLCLLKCTLVFKVSCKIFQFNNLIH